MVTSTGSEMNNNLLYNHEIWAYTCGEKGEKLNIHGEDLRGLDLNLSQRNLSFAVIEHCNLSELNLSDTDFSNAVLTGSNLLGANLKNVDFFNAEIIDIKIVEPKEKRENILLKAMYLLANNFHGNKPFSYWICSASSEGEKFKELYGEDIAAMILVGPNVWYNVRYEDPDSKSLWYYLRYKLNEIGRNLP